MNASGSDQPTHPESAPVPLVEPQAGTPDVVADTTALRQACDRLAAGTGPVAIDTERASGYRYFPRAYLVQLRRQDTGTVLVDPVALRGELGDLGKVLNAADWVLHAASQDLPCLAELDLHPAGLFDTELAGRLAGFPRVALGSLIEDLLGYRLEKGHSAADWSRRPLPPEWLNYAALDVELLLQLREHLEAELTRQGKRDWARQEFAAVRDAPPQAPRAEPWRRTSGIHKIRTARGLAGVRALWQARDSLARKRDRAPGRVLPDKAIIEAVLADPRTADELRAVSVFGGQRQRRHTKLWLHELQAARVLPEGELPSVSAPYDGPPPASRWADRDPVAAARLTAGRTALSSVAEANQLPLENLLRPELLRRVCWEPPEDRSPAGVATALREQGAREWQIELTSREISDSVREGTA